MNQPIAVRARQATRSSLKWVLKTPPLQRLYYSVRNADEFENLQWHDLMLADRVRMSTYARAIEALVPEGSVVVDVGTGTGVLACLAARRARKVYAIEHSPLIHRATRLAEGNGISNVEFVPTHSREFTPDEQVDVLLHEQIGMNLIDEDMIGNLGDLRRRILRPGGSILPGRFRLQVVPISLRDDARVPFVHEQRVEGLDFTGFAEVNEPEIEARGWDRQLIDPRTVGSTFAPPATLFGLDLAADDTSQVPASSSAGFTAEHDGILDGFAVFFSVEFSDEIGFETGPGSPWTHWQCRLYRTGQRQVLAGDRLSFSLGIEVPTDAQSWTWSFDLTSGE